MYDIAVLGNSPVDILSNVTDDVIENNDINKGDYNELPADKFYIISHPLEIVEKQSGGSAANTAWAMGKMGIKTAFIGKVGNDDEGQLFYNDMLNAGVFMPKPVDGVETMKVHCLVTPDGQRTFVSKGPTAPMGAGCVDEEIIKNSKWIFIEGYLMAGQMDSVDRAFELARKHNTKIAISLSAEFIVSLFYKNIFSEIMKGADLILANDVEMEMLLQSAEELAAKEHDDSELKSLVSKLRCTDRVITHGGEGATFFKSEKGEIKKFFVPTEKQEAPVDTTGGGDAFAAGFLAKYISDDDYNEALIAGHKLAGNVIMQMGGRIKNLEIFSKI